MFSNKSITVNFPQYFNISTEAVLYFESVILLTKNGHVAYNGTKMCMWGPRGSLKNWVSLYNYTTHILTPSHTHHIQYQPLNLQKAHTHPLALICIQKYLFSAFIIQKSQIVGNVVVYLITSRMEKRMWTLAFKNNEHEIKILNNEKLILFTVKLMLPKCTNRSTEA